MSEEYRGIPLEVVTEVGRLTIVGTALEHVIYEMCDALGIHPADSRRKSARDAADLIKDQLAVNGVPAWSTADSDAIRVWCSAAKSALAARGSVVHGTYSTERGVDDRWTMQREPANLRDRAVPVDIQRDQAVRENLERREDEGASLLFSLLGQLCEGVYLFVYGPKRREVAIVRDDGAYAELAEPQLNALIEAFWTTWHREAALAFDPSVRRRR